MNKLKNFPPVNFISIENSIDRQKVLYENFEKYGITNITPHIYKKYNDNDHKIIGKDVDTLCPKVHRGPVTSHLKAIKEWYENTNEEYAFFCEDDLSFETVEYWNFTWEEFFNRLPHNWECVQLSFISTHNDYTDERIVENKSPFRYRDWCDWSGCAYLIKRSHAKNIVENYFDNDTIILEYKGFDYDVRLNSGDTRWLIPTPESMVYTYFIPDTIYFIPLFVEDLRFHSTWTDASNNDSYHKYSYEKVLNWWKVSGSSLSINHLMNKSNLLSKKSISVIQIGTNRANDDLSNFLLKNYQNLDFSLFVEPNSLHIGEIKRCYSQYTDINVENLAIKSPLHNQDTLRIYYHTNEHPYYQIATCNLEHLEKHMSWCPHLQGGEVKFFDVPCITLENLFDKYQIKELDWLLLDVEGLDSEIITTFNWKKYKINRIEFEHLHLGDDADSIVEMFLNMGYIQVESLHEYDWAFELNKMTNIKETEMNQLIEFSLDTENAEKNYNLAQWYESNGHTAPAHSYYLRAAERAMNKLLSYHALLRASFCYRTQGSRDATEKILLENALMLLPERPEAYYFLSMLYERKQEWQNSYIYANLGLQQKENDEFEIIVSEYSGKHLLFYQKAVAAWWWGRGKESRELFHLLIDEYWNDLSENLQNSVEDNITRLGSGPESQAFHTYTKEDYKNLRYQFSNSNIIERNYSQVYQDMFILSMLNGKKNGTFLEIGGAEPFKGNNTALLEKTFDWDGVSIEYDQKFVDYYRNNRSAKLLHTDALQLDYEKLLSENFEGNIIDYLQLDIEPARHTYECMLKIPFDKYKFAVITYEHDYYVDVTRSYREKSREFLESKGYELIVNDISPDGISNFEDWWVHPDLVDESIVKRMKSVVNTTQHAKEYILTPGEEKMNFFNLSADSKSTSWIVDNFYEDPDKVREFALKQEYVEGGFGRGFIGRRTQEQFLFPGLKEKFEEIMGRKITRWEEHGMNGRFQLAWSGEPLVYHCDSQQWGGMLYLTPNAPYQCGTTLYAHKTTRARTYYDEGWDAAWVDVPGDCHLDGTPFEPVDVLGNVYNRLVIFDASAIHSASQYFGTVKENARLWQMFFFDT